MVCNDNRSQHIISKNSSPDVYVESRLVNSDEDFWWILVVPDVTVSAVEVAISCEAGLISSRPVQERQDSRCSVAKTTGQIEHEV